MTKTKMTQKEAVFQAITSVLSDAGVDVSEGANVATMMDREKRAQVNSILFQGFKGGAIEIETEFTDTQLKTYVSGLQSNWLRKDKRLNGGGSYTPKQPGLRAGSGDPQLKALRALLASKTNPAERAEIQGYIDARVGAIKAERKPTVQINVNDLPAALRKYA
jgi:hypothetical protein